ncbi:jg16784 [Pararge aegeria aegeria]|uniref:Jg16784 protein n=1 Tax=Pararge aegeria aegeria TaxID=348720 RepID=A0A8S4RRX3_9NEOP|nr:jg16784 [Pararge aegeria aegeria]
MSRDHYYLVIIIEFRDAAEHVLISAATLRILLSFAVGGLLGDVFLHLLPEAWQHDLASTEEGQHVSMKCGLWCLFGMLVFIVVEKLFAGSDDEEEEEEEKETPKLNGNVDHIEIEDLEKLLEEERKTRGKGKGEGICGNGNATAKQLYDTCVFNNNTKGEGVCCSAITTKNGTVRCKGNRWMGRCLLREAKEKTMKASKEKSEKKDVAGYLNLMANSIDNFTHGLAVGGSFLVGFRVGLLTTFAILGKLESTMSYRNAKETDSFPHL